MTKKQPPKLILRMRSPDQDREEKDDQETGTPEWRWLVLLLLFKRENLEGLGWKFRLLCKSWLEGLIIWRRKALSELALAITAIFKYSSDILLPVFFLRWSELEFRWRWHRNEPGWVVGEHRQLRCFFGFSIAFFVPIDDSFSLSLLWRISGVVNRWLDSLNVFSLSTSGRCGTGKGRRRLKWEFIGVVQLQDQPWTLVGFAEVATRDWRVDFLLLFFF